MSQTMLAYRNEKGFPTPRMKRCGEEHKDQGAQCKNQGDARASCVKWTSTKGPRAIEG